MCFYVCINNGESELRTPREFNDFFKKEILDEPNELLKDCCLCGWIDDIEEYFNQNNIQYEEIEGDLYLQLN